VTTGARPTADFIRAKIADDLAAGRAAEPALRAEKGGRVVTRFPPEPNGYLHVGHVASICLNFGVAEEFGGRCHLRFDDTNPVKEEQKFIDAIIEDVRWLGFDWGEHLYYASDYFEQLHDWAVALIRAGRAYVCDLSADQIREYRGTLTAPGRPSPWRERAVAENLDLFARMRGGEFPDGTRTLRAKIDMASPNVNLRDPILYRILHARHPRTGDAWCIYPTYDWAHGQSDSIEGITHSLCTLEFEDHRPLYDWFIDALGIHHPQQIEFARVNVSYMVTSKRRLHRLVAEGHVRGWDDPRMSTVAGMRRRGYTPEALRRFCQVAGLAKRNRVVDVALLEHALREDLNRRAPRFMGVLRPLRVVVENYPEGRTEELEAVNNPEDPAAGTRAVPFSRELLVERDDFMEDPPRKFHRLAPGREVRLRYAYLVTCTGVEKDPRTGEVSLVRCRYDPATRGGSAPDGRRVQGTIHWVSAPHAVAAEVRLYDRLYTRPVPGEADDDGPGGSTAPSGAEAKARDFIDDINPASLEIVKDARVEPRLADPSPGLRFQLERLGYFCADPDGRPGAPVFNRTVTLRDSWAKASAGGAGGGASEGGASGGEA
jgi:glutaminyl-tRNA synthetase